jgi:hypothetical protein
MPGLPRRDGDPHRPRNPLATGDDGDAYGNCAVTDSGKLDCSSNDNNAFTYVGGGILALVCLGMALKDKGK